MVYFGRYLGLWRSSGLVYWTPSVPDRHQSCDIGGV